MSRIESIVERICLARGYTESLIDAVDPGDWFRMPSEGVTHVAWQVGHLAAAQYSLALRRIRGTKPADAELISDEFKGPFAKGSTPQAEAESYPSPDEIRRVFDRVHRQAVEEISQLADSQLDEPLENPHPMFSTRMGSLLFCPEHELLHAGQIGLLRRLFGNKPLR